MEIQVQELIDKIKSDGIKTATEEANRIKAEAEAAAAQIIESAKKEAESILSGSKLEAEKAEKAGIAALQQASRNLILVFKDEIQAIINKTINDVVCAAYNGDVIKAALPEILKNWAAKGSNDMTVILPESELSKLQGFLNDKLKSELGKGVELRSNRKLTYGFHISNKQGSVYYDFSSEAVTALLSTYLNPKLASVLQEASKGI